ncbi:uncharacterized protein LOC117262044 isoform X1 [Epinephelus lanceolatus]
MGLYLKITAGLLLLVQAFHLAALQESTDSPGKTIDKGWLRELVKNEAVSQNTAFPKDEGDYYQEADANAEFSSGTASGSMAVNTEEEQNVAGTTPNNLTAVTTEVPTTSNATMSPNATTADAINSSQVNMTGAEEEFHNWTMTPQNSTTHLSAQNSTSFPDNSNGTDLQTTTLAPESNATQASTTKPDEDKGLINATESTSTTTVTTTVKPEIKETSTTSSSTTVSPFETTETDPGTTTAAAPITPEKANETDKDAASGSSSERGLATDTQKTKRNGAWGAVLGTGVAVAFVALVAYVILKKKHRKGFSHRKLEEEYPSDPVLRLDTSEPMDLNFGIGGSAYYNPGLQGDNIQMSNFPGRHRN